MAITLVFFLFQKKKSHQNHLSTFCQLSNIFVSLMLFKAFVKIYDKYILSNFSQTKLVVLCLNDKLKYEAQLLIYFINDTFIWIKD